MTESPVPPVRGATIIAIRERRLYSRRALARAAEVSLRHLTQVELHDVQPGNVWLEKVRQTLRCQVDDFRLPADEALARIEHRDTPAHAAG